MNYLGKLLYFNALVEQVALIHKGVRLDFKFLQIVANNMFLYQFRVTQDWIERSHLFMREVVLKSLLVHLVIKLRLAFNKQGDVSYI